MNPILFNSYGKSPLLQNTVCHFKFDNNIIESTKLITTAISSLGIDFVTGKIGNAVRFDATGDRIGIVNTPLLSFTDGTNDLPFSINMWVYFTGFSATGNWIINKRTSVLGSIEWQLVTQPNKLVLYKFDKSTAVTWQSIITTNTLTTGQWYMISATDDGSKTVAGMKLYINGTLASTSNNSTGTYTGMPLSTAGIMIGQAAWNTTNANLQHRGYIDLLSIYKNRVLSAYEIGLLYNSGNGLDYVF